jgi:hypothetical protein
MTDPNKITLLLNALNAMLATLKPEGKLITSTQVNELSGELVVTYSDGTIENVGVVKGENGVGLPGVSVVNVKLATDPLRPGEVFFNVELSNGITLQTQDSISGYNGKSISNAYAQNESLYFVLDNGDELPPIPVANLKPVSITGARIDNNNLFILLSNGTEVDAGLAGDLKGVGVDFLRLDNGSLTVKYSNSATPVELGKIKSLESLIVEGAELKATFSDAPETKIKIDNYVYFTGGKIVDGELILLTNQTAPGNEINLGPVSNLKGDNGASMSAIEITNNEIIVTLDDGTKLPAIPVAGLEPISVTGARYDSTANEVFLVLSNGNEISTGIGNSFKGDTGVSIVGVELKADGKLNVAFSNNPTAPVTVGQVPSLMNMSLKQGKLVARYNTNPDAEVVLGDVRSIANVVNSAGVIKITYTDGTSDNVGNLRSISNFRIVDGKLQVTYSDTTSEVVGEVVGPAGKGIESAQVDGNGDLIITMTDQTPQNAGRVRVDMQNLLGDIYEFTSTAGQLEYSVPHDGKVLFFAGNTKLPASEYNATQSDRITLNTALPTNTAVSIITFVTTAFQVTSRGVTNVTNVNGVYKIKLQDNTEFTIDTNSVIDPVELPPGVKDTKIVNNRLIVTLTDNRSIDAGPTTTAITVTGCEVVNSRLIIKLSNDTQIDAGSVASNLTIESVAINPQGQLVIKFTGNQEFNAGVISKFVTGAAIQSGNLMITLSDETTLNAGQVVNPLIGQVFDYVAGAGQFEFPVQHQGNQVLVTVQGSTFGKDDIDLTTPLVRLKTPRNEGDAVRIVLVSSGNVTATGITGDTAAPENSFYGKRAGQLGFHTLNLTTIGKPYTFTTTAGQTVLNNVFHNGKVLIWRGDRFLQPDQYNLPADNSRVILTVAAAAGESITVLALSDSKPMGQFNQTSYSNVYHQTTSQGGTFSAGAWRTRQLNAIGENGLNLQVANNRIVMDAGIYYVEGWAACQGVRSNVLKLIDVTNNKDLLTGPSVMASVSENPSDVHANSYTPIDGYFVLDSQAAVQLQHRCLYTKASNGFGAVGGGLPGSTPDQSGLGMPARLVNLKFWKVG